jgi:tRNA(Arg) A34 adenosine deaminase TadA
MVNKMTHDEHFMHLALAKAREGVNQGGSPFGACLVKEGEVLASAHNQVLQNTDITPTG